MFFIRNLPTFVAPTGAHSPHICCSNRCPPVPHSERWKNRAAKGTEVATRGMELKTGVRKASTVKSMARWYLPSGKHMEKTSNQWNPEMAHSMKPRILCGYPALNHWNLRVLGQWAAKMWIQPPNFYHGFWGGLSGASRGRDDQLPLSSPGRCNKESRHHHCRESRARALTGTVSRRSQRLRKEQDMWDVV